MASWPTTLPAPRGNGYAIDPEEQVIRTQMEFGSARVRRQTFARVDSIKSNWLFTDAQMAIFRAWFESSTGAAGGASWFDITLPTGDGGARLAQARFSTAPAMAQNGRRFWQVTATLEVR